MVSRFDEIFITSDMFQDYIDVTETAKEQGIETIDHKLSFNILKFIKKTNNGPLLNGTKRRFVNSSLIVDLEKQLKFKV